MRMLVSCAAIAALLVLTAVGSSTAARTADADGMVRVIVTLEAQADLRQAAAMPPKARLRAVITALKATATAKQGPIRAFLAERRALGDVRTVTPLWVFNGLVVTAIPAVIAELAARPDVAGVRTDAELEAPLTPLAEANIELVGAPLLWAQGIRGQGVVIASMDTGVDVGHPDLAAQWRGGSSAWFDPNGEHTDAPFDANGHGTWTTGVIVGRDAGGTAVGMSPDSRWIAVKIFNDRGVAALSGIHAGFQWLLDPDGDPATADAPQIVNNSWTFGAPGCDLEFELDLEALRAAGIVPVFAAGNGGPAPNTSISPANNPAALAVGATDDSDSAYPLSSRGPSACGEAETVYPELVAPGVDVRTTDLFGGYLSVSGTSLAAPHVTGALALLLSAYPDLTGDDVEGALLQAAIDLSPSGPDPDFGYGRLDVHAAFELLAAEGARPLLLSLARDAPADAPNLAGIGDEDVVQFDGERFSLVFDGSDVGLSTGVDAVAASDADTLLLSFRSPVRLAGLGLVDDSDVVRFDADRLEPETAGVFTLVFDGSDVGLTTNGEDVDSIGVLDDGRFLVSTESRADVPGVRAEGHDILAFAVTALGPDTSGTWALLFDGSDVGLTKASERVDGATVGPDGAVYLTTIGAFAVPGVSGSGDDVFVCVPLALGPATSCSYRLELFLDGAAAGLAGLGVEAIAFASPAATSP